MSPSKFPVIPGISIEIHPDGNFGLLSSAQAQETDSATNKKAANLIQFQMEFDRIISKLPPG
jgi:hypothetical protein